MIRVVPPELEDDLKRATRLEWWTLGWMASVIAVMGLAAGGSQAMKTAWIEDILSLVPAIVFLVALRLERKGPNRRFPYGYQRANSLAFLIAAVTLSIFGGVLLFESTMTLIRQEHPTIGPISLFGESIWMGWVMVAALSYSVIAPMILGYLKLPLARRLSDKVLHTDALMQKADWQTGLAGIAGVIGVGLGLWWADAVAAALISASILYDGIRALRAAAAELTDGAPRAIDSNKVSKDAEALRKALEKRFGGAEVRLRETGRYIRAQVACPAPAEPIDLRALWPGQPDCAWRFSQLSFVPPQQETD